MAFKHTIARRVSFHETDMAGLVHFSNFFRWMEDAEHAFLQSVGFPPVKQEGDYFWGWPRARARCDYREPLRFGDRFECEVYVKEIKLKSVSYFFRFYKLAVGDEGGERIAVAKGEMTSVYAGFDVSERQMKALDLARDLLDKIEEAPSEAMKRDDL